MTQVTRQDVQALLKEAEAAFLAAQPYDQDADAETLWFTPLLTALAASIGVGLVALGVLLVFAASGAWGLAAGAESLAFGAFVVVAASVRGVWRR